MKMVSSLTTNLNVSFLGTYHTKKGDLRAILNVNNRKMRVKCNNKINSLISGHGYSIEVIGICAPDFFHKGEVTLLINANNISTKHKLTL